MPAPELAALELAHRDAAELHAEYEAVRAPEKKEDAADIERLQEAMASSTTMHAPRSPARKAAMIDKSRSQRRRQTGGRPMTPGGR